MAANTPNHDRYTMNSYYENVVDDVELLQESITFCYYWEIKFLKVNSDETVSTKARLALWRELLQKKVESKCYDLPLIKSIIPL